MTAVNKARGGVTWQRPACVQCGKPTSKSGGICAGCLRTPTNPALPIFGGLPGEEWRTIPAFPDYSASNLGRIRRDTAGQRATVGRILRDGVHPVTHYRGVTLRDDAGRERSALIHSLVMSAFVGPRPALHETNHIDGNKANNALSNLEYVTKSENTIHAVRLGLRPYSNRRGAPKD